MEKNLPASISNKRFESTMMSSPVPSFAKSNGMKKKTTTFSRFIRTDRAAGGLTNGVKKKTVSVSRFSRVHRVAEDLTRELAGMSLKKQAVQPRRRYSFTNEFPDDPPKPAPNRRCSLVRRNSINLPIESNFDMSVLMDDDDEEEEDDEMMMAKEEDDEMMMAKEEEDEVQDLNMTSGSINPATSTSKGAIPKPPKNFGFTF
uniref:Uncharacterized protein, isoform B n=1 Tax=Drosophila melanogaster TaxID=7227 RepID=M9NGI4_DROME|nr:uncharacterized protein Dmel_CG14810, isoform B [Drosophila melanogaster]AFH07196.1 uncharacterized protein Dmel_CG14810, isoform B [Drosophila melanogaster]|eukprot:NP_001245482.1 uncharacterized protein Dmel_CG14810, isoform B [Drosophila melanogaster]